MPRSFDPNRFQSRSLSGQEKRVAAKELPIQICQTWLLVAVRGTVAGEGVCQRQRQQGESPRVFELIIFVVAQRLLLSVRSRLSRMQHVRTPSPAQICHSAVARPAHLCFHITVLRSPCCFLFGGVGASRTASTFGNSGSLRFKLIERIRHKNQQAFDSLAA